jgi:hypothetical protein
MRSNRFELLLTDEERKDWNEGARLAGLTLSGYVRRCLTEARELERVLELQEQRSQRQAARLAGMDPVLVRDLDLGNKDRF